MGRRLSPRNHFFSSRPQLLLSASFIYIYLYAQSRPRRPVLTEEGELSMRTRIVALAIVLTVTLPAAPSFAHHSDVAYDQTKRTTLKDAKVISYAWRNPHGIMVLDVKDETGEVVRWTLETGSPSALMIDGWTKNSVVAGDVITVDANPARNGTKLGRLLRVAKADGTVLTWGERNRVSQ
jgi:Family of unknown function (DUF6152)